MTAYTRLIGFRYGFSRQRSRFTALVAIASMLGMMLGVASLIVVLSVMNGFGAELRGRILALVPHAYVELLPGEPLSERLVLAEQLETLPEVVAATPFQRETVLLSGSFRQQGAVMFGLDPAVQSRVTDLDRYMLRGDLAALEEGFSVVLGVTLARNLGVIPGDTVRVVLPQLTTTPLGVFPRSRSLTVVGLFEVGAQQDAQLAYVSLDTADRLLRGRSVQGLQLRLNDMMAASSVAVDVLPAAGEGARVVPWMETQGTLFRAVRMEKITVAILLLSVVLVAAFNIVSTLAMAVAEKRSDIAVLRTMGATPGEISRIFVTQGLGLACLGIAGGALAGIALASNIGTLVDSVERLFGQRLFDPQVYYISSLPSQLQMMDVLWVVLSALMLSLLATLYPAWRASRIAPAEVLRYE
ncbi:MAG: lipoprotein-releasing ABC transporter permease subunit [Congregibacter sp.]